MQNQTAAKLNVVVTPSRSTSSGLPLVDDPRWQLVQRIATSRSLGRSALLSDFLLYICDRQLRGKAANITEQRIGVRVFGRPEGYNSNEDNIVRNYARTLRKRIDEYFETEGTQEVIRLEIPRGGYIPVFIESSAVASESLTSSDLEVSQHSVEELAVNAPQELPVAPATVPRASSAASPAPATDLLPSATLFGSRRGFALTVAAFMAVLAVGITIGRFFTASPAGLRLQPSVLAATDDGRNFSFWAHIFQQKQDTYLVPADGGLVMMQSFTRQPVSVADYARGTYRNHAEVEQQLEPVTSRLSPELSAKLLHRVEVLGDRRYTSMVDLDLTSQLSRLPAVVPERLMIRYARDLRIDDLRSGNVILLGSSDANPWVDLFQSQLNFRFDSGLDGGSQRIMNQHPLAGEQPMYFSDANDLLHHTFGVVAFLPNLSNTGYVLIVEGINMAGTQAAGDFLLNAESMRPVLQRAIAPNGTIRSFELLLSTSDIAANASRTQILSERIHDN